MAVQEAICRGDGRGRPPPPAVAPPARRVLATLCQEDRELLGKLLTEPQDFVDHPQFCRRGAEAALFGQVAKLRRNQPPRFPEPAPVVAEKTRGGSTIPTLTAEQERMLFLRLNYSRMRVQRILVGHVKKALTASATRDLLGWHHRVLVLRAEIVRLNVPLVLAMAKRTRLHSIDFNELISEGNMALLRSVDKFDCGRGFKFSTYACRAILKAFSRVAMRASRYRGRFPAEFDPALEQDHYSEEKRKTIEEDCVDELKSILLKNLADLTEVEQTVIRERFALRPVDPDNPSPKTLEQVGSIIGVTKERVRQIQNKALRKIRNALEERYLAA